MAMEIAVIGGGVAGLCTATELARLGHTAVLLERHARLFEETSTHNSGVIHAGLYYPSGSLKARSCVTGNRLTREFCEQYGVSHRICGKVIAAYSETEAAELDSLYRQAKQNGATGVRLITPDELNRIEPTVRPAVSALYSPATGILDIGDYLKAREREAIRAGVTILTSAEVLKIGTRNGRFTVRSSRGDLATDAVINAAGLWTDNVETLAGLIPKPVRPCRGEYFVVTGAKAQQINGLVYPVPHSDRSGLGVHLTKTVSGDLLIGPNVRWIDSKTDYETDREPLDRFLESTRKLLPGLEPGDLREAYTGIRPKLSGPGDPSADFEIADNRVDGALFLSLRGIESPGLTAAPALALEVANRISRL